MIFVQNATQVSELLTTLPETSLIFVDVDDTLITPVSKAFRLPLDLQIIDHIKINKDKYPHYEEIVSKWRLQRQIQLIDPRWPAVLDSLKEKHLVFGLTQMDTGSFGVIDSMEKWRFDELAKFGIHFTEKFPFSQSFSPKEVFILNPQNPRGAAFYGGIFFTGTDSKGAVLELLQTNDNLPSSHIILIDDRPHQLAALEEVCAQRDIPFTGILFEGARDVSDQPDPRIVAFQQKYLLENYVWLEDDKAEEYLLREGPHDTTTNNPSHHSSPKKHH